MVHVGDEEGKSAAVESGDCGGQLREREAGAAASEAGTGAVGVASGGHKRWGGGKHR